MEKGAVRDLRRFLQKAGIIPCIKHKEYIGIVDFDPEIDLFHGTVTNTHDVITFYGASVAELRKEMQIPLEVCEEQGKVPENTWTQITHYLLYKKINICEKIKN